MTEEVVESSTSQDETTSTPETQTGSTEGAEPTRTETEGEQQQAPSGETQEQDAKTPKWVQRRIDQLTREKYEERRQREALEATLSSMRTVGAESTETSSTQPTQAEIDARVQRAAREQLRVQQFNDACNRAYEAGKKEFKDFDDSLRNFGMLGGLPQEFLEIASSMPDGHKVLYALGKNPEEASRVLSLPPLQMAMELARVADKVTKQPSKAVSGAPAPIQPVDGTVKGSSEPPENIDDWMRWRNENRRKATR